jgi:hypothetical protein
MLGWETIPHRTTLSRRYKQLYETIQQFMAFVGQYAPDLDESFRREHLIEDKSLFKALGPVWHQSDRKAGGFPTSYAIWTPMRPGPKAVIMAGCMGMACT